MGAIMDALRRIGLEHPAVQNTAAVLSKFPAEWLEYLVIGKSANKVFVTAYWSANRNEVFMYIGERQIWTIRHIYVRVPIITYKLPVYYDTLPEGIIDCINVTIRELKLSE